MKIIILIISMSLVSCSTYMKGVADDFANLRMFEVREEDPKAGDSKVVSGGGVGFHGVVQTLGTLAEIRNDMRPDPPRMIPMPNRTISKPYQNTVSAPAPINTVDRINMYNKAVYGY